MQDFGNITQTKEFRTFLVRAELLNAANMRKLASVPRIAGVIVFQQKDEHEALAKPYSPQKVSPNDEITASKYAWNPKVRFQPAQSLLALCNLAHFCFLISVSFTNTQKKNQNREMGCFLNLFLLALLMLKMKRKLIICF